MSLASVPFQQFTPSFYELDLSSVTGAAGSYVFTLNANTSGVIDQAGNPLAASPSINWVTDKSVPTVAVTTITPMPRNTVVGTIAVNFSEAVTGMNLADFSLLLRNGLPVDLIGLTLNTISTSRYSLNLASVTSAPGEYTFNFNPTGVLDMAGNRFTIGARRVWTMDTQSPTATFSGDLASPRNSRVRVVTVTFDEPVIGVNLADFTLTRGGRPVSLAGLAVLALDGANYTIDLSTKTAAAGNYVLTLKDTGSGIVDAANNSLAAAAIASWTTDVKAPTVAVVAVTPDPRTTPVGNVTFNISEDVTGVDLADFNLMLDGTAVDLTGAISRQ